MQLVALLRAELLLAKGASLPADFTEVLDTFDSKVFLREEISAFSNSVTLAVARIACRTGSIDAAAAWDGAFDEAREIAARTPLDAPWVFRRLEEAAREASETARQVCAASAATQWEARKARSIASLGAAGLLILN